jgi:hypothetical protein
VDRSDGAKRWARVLSELAQVEVTVEWERPAWRVYWQDGPTREVLMARAAALGGYRVGAPLPFEQLRFIRSNSVTAIALGWLAHGSPDIPSPSPPVGEVEAWCEDTGYPGTRFDERALAAADLLGRLGRGDITEMGQLLAHAYPPVPPQPSAEQGPELRGSVTSFRWPSGGPPADLLGPTATPNTTAPATCALCGKPLEPTRGRGRPARYCSGSCRTAAHRARKAEEAAA